VEQAITVVVPGEIKLALEDAARQEGVSADELVAKELRQYLLVRQYRSLRQRMVPQAQSQGVSTDKDVFDRVS